MKLEEIFKTLGFPLALVAVVVALLAWAGLSIDQLYVVVGALVGFQLLFAFVIDVLKWAGVVDEGTSGKWNAGFQLFALVAVAVQMKLFPSFDLYGADAKVAELVKVAAIVLAYIMQIAGAKAFHTAGLSKVKGFRF